MMNNLPLGYKRDADGNIVIDEQKKNCKHLTSAIMAFVRCFREEYFRINQKILI